MLSQAALVVYVAVWAALCLARALSLRRGRQWSWQGRSSVLSFTGWALVWEWRLSSSPSDLGRSRSSSLLPSTVDPRRSSSRSSLNKGGEGPSWSVLLFWVGQAAMVAFLGYNIVASLHDSRSANAGGVEHRRRRLLVTLGGKTVRVVSRMRPMAFLLPSSSSAADEGTADWRFVWWAALFALAVHEHGHARAARKEGLLVQRTGIYLAVVVPGAYVTIPEAVKDLNPWARLRVVCAGVAANAALCLVLALLALAGLPSRLVTLPEPGGGAVLRSIPPFSPLGAALRPGDSIVGLQDVPIVDGAGEVVALLKEHVEATRARSAGLLRAVVVDGARREGEGFEEQQQQEQHGEGPSLSLRTLNVTVARLIGEARLTQLEEAGLLSPELFCTHLDLMEGEEEGRQQAPSCCSFDALVGREQHSPTEVDVNGGAGASSSTSCFAYLPAGAADERGRLQLTCLPARELALHSHAVGVRQAAARGDRARPFCFRHVSVPPNVLLKIALGSGRTVTFEGRVDDVANAALAAGLADTRPRAWVRALLPARWAMDLDALFVKGLAALVDVSVSLAAVNLVPFYRFDGALALHEGVLLLARRLPPAGKGRQRLLQGYRIGVLVVGFLFATNVLLACLAVF